MANWERSQTWKLWKTSLSAIWDSINKSSCVASDRGLIIVKLFWGCLLNGGEARKHGKTEKVLLDLLQIPCGSNLTYNLKISIIFGKRKPSSIFGVKVALVKGFSDFSRTFEHLHALVLESDLITDFQNILLRKLVPIWSTPLEKANLLQILV